MNNIKTNINTTNNNYVNIYVLCLNQLCSIFSQYKFLLWMDISLSWFSEEYVYIYTFEQFIKRTLFCILGSIIFYFALASWIEYGNPMPKNQIRMANIYREIKVGLGQIVFSCVTSMSFYYYIYPKTKYYRSFETDDLGIITFIVGFVFQFIFQTFFSYWVHRLNHFPILYNWIHRVHHTFKEPTAFGAVASHPLEGFLEVNLLLHITELIMPIHPLCTLLSGMHVAYNEMIGHDGGESDSSDHYKHHLYYTVNFNEPIIDKLFGTAYDAKQFPVKAKCSYVDDVYKYKGAIFDRYK